MKEMTKLVLTIIVLAAILLLFRYEVKVYSPIIVKLDRLTGNAWVANSGVWMAIK